MSASIKHRLRPSVWELMNWPLLFSAVCLMFFGVIMVTSASISIADNRFGDAFLFGRKHLFYVCIGLVCGFAALRTPTRWLENLSFVFLMGALGLLVLVLIPGVGKSLNGSQRWISFGVVTFQISEFARIALLIYLASYMVRRGDEVRTELKGFIKPLIVITVASALLLAEPDFGAAAVLCGTCLGLLFMAGARLRLFLFGLVVVAALGVLMISFEAYRLDRFAFLDPWKDPYGSAYQLTQSLIAIGSGGITGLGLGGSVQKLFYLPEAHNDFLFAILAEELGLIGVMTLLSLYVVLIYQIIQTGARALKTGQHFGTYLCYGIAIWLSAQVFINLGVSMGILPTKGLILPLMSSGGSAIMVTCLSVGMVLRVHYESMLASHAPVKRKKAKSKKDTEEAPLLGDAHA